jgi:hypothetical protein
VVVRLVGSTGKVMGYAQTLAIRKSDGRPRWTRNLNNRLLLHGDVIPGDRAVLTVEVWNRDVLGNDMLGCASIDVTSWIPAQDAGTVSSTRFVLSQLRDATGEVVRGDLALRAVLVRFPEGQVPSTVHTAIAELDATEVTDAYPLHRSSVQMDAHAQDDTDARSYNFSRRDAELDRFWSVFEDLASGEPDFDAVAEVAAPAAGKVGQRDQKPRRSHAEGRLKVSVKSATHLKAPSVFVTALSPQVKLSLHGPVGSMPSHAITHPYLGPHGTSPSWSEPAGTRYLRYSALTGDVWTLRVSVYHNAGRRRRNDALLGTGHVDVSGFVGSTCPPETFVVMLRSPSGKSDRGIVLLSVEGLLGLFRVVGDASSPQMRAVTAAEASSGETSEVAPTTHVSAPPSEDGEDFVVPANSLYRGEEYRCQLVVTLVEVRHLVHTSSYLQQAPYGILTLYGQGAHAVCFGQTETVSRGGDNPRWPKGNTIDLVYAAKRSQPLKLQCEIWNSRTFVGDQLLGKGRVDVSSLIGRNRTNVFLEIELRAPDRVSVAGIACVCVHNHVLQVGDGPREAKHKYSVVDLIGTPAPHVTEADRAVTKPNDVTLHGDVRHRATPSLCLGPWLAYKHVVVMVAAGGCHSMCITQGRDLLSRRLWAW